MVRELEETKISQPRPRPPDFSKTMKLPEEHNSLILKPRANRAQQITYGGIEAQYLSVHRGSLGPRIDAVRDSLH